MDQSPFYLFVRDIRRWKQISAERQAELRELSKAGDEQAREELICTSIPLAIKIAREFPITGTTLEDRIQEAVLTLTRCADRWEPEKSRLSTYLSAAVKFRLCRMIRHERLVRPPYSTPITELRSTEPLVDFANIQEDQLPYVVDDHDREHQERLESIRQARLLLPKRLQDVLGSRSKGKTLREIGERLGLSKERVRQLEEEALRLLREQLTTSGE